VSQLYCSTVISSTCSYTHQYDIENFPTTVISTGHKTHH